MDREFLRLITLVAIVRETTWSVGLIWLWQTVDALGLEIRHCFVRRKCVYL